MRRIDPMGQAIRVLSAALSCTLCWLCLPECAAAITNPAVDWARTFMRPDGGEDNCVDSHTDGTGKTYVLVQNEARPADVVATLLTYGANGSLLGELDLRIPGIVNSAAYSLREMAMGSSGNIYVVGSMYANRSRSFLTVKFAPDGIAAWSRTYVESDTQRYASATRVAPDDSGVTVAGYRYEDGGTRYSQLVRYSNHGVFQWNYPMDYESYGDLALAADGLGNYFLTVPSIVEKDTYLLKVSADGEELFKVSLGTLYHDNYAMVYRPADAGLYIGVASNREVIIKKADGMTGYVSRSLIYEIFDIQNRFMFTICGIGLDGSGSVYVAGITAPYDSIGIRLDTAGILKFDSALSGLMWFREYGCECHMYPSGFGMDSEENIYIAGSIMYDFNLPDMNCPVSQDRNDVWLGKYSAAGNEIWTKKYDGPARTAIRAVLPAPGGGAFAAGDAAGKAMLLRYDSSGARLWEKYLESPDHCEMTPLSGMHEKAGVIYLATRANNAADEDYDEDVLIFKTDYSGNPLGAIAYDYPDIWAWNSPIAVDKNGDIYVAIDPWNENDESYEYDLLLVKLAASPAGWVVWEKAFPVVGSELVADIDLDESGNIYVLMEQEDSTPNAFVLSKHANSGKVLWKKTYPGSLADEAKGTSLKVREGAIYFCGYEADLSASRYGGAVCKVDSAGNLLWKREYRSENAIFNGLDLDQSGNVMVGGMVGSFQAGEPTNADVLAVSYDSNGKALWAQAYDSGNPLDGVNGIAAGSLYLGGSIDASSSLVKVWEEPLLVELGPASLFPNPVTGDSVEVRLPLREDAQELTIWIFNIAYEPVYKGVWWGVGKGNASVAIERMLQRAPGRYLVKARAVLVNGETQDFPVLKMVVKR